MKKNLISYFLFLISYFAAAQTNSIGCYPTNWWVGMKNPKLQLMIHEKDIANKAISIKSYPGIKLEKINKVENPNYIFIDLIISKDAKPGTLILYESDPKYSKSKAKIFSLELKAKRKNEDGKTRIQGVTSSDFIYLIMPDRFSDEC